MFSSATASRLSSLRCAAVSAARSFLLLEDADMVDWEVDADGRAIEDHPHREPLRGRPSWARRPGQPPSPAQLCLSPLPRSRRPPRDGNAGERTVSAPQRA
ncbi:MAG: hypothetical protein ACYCX7_09240 [Solirubrobacteraceae bacterium]